MEKRALPFASTNFSNLCHRCSTKLASALSNRYDFFHFLLFLGKFRARKFSFCFLLLSPSYQIRFCLYGNMDCSG
ncbi:hypothetical protein D8674_026804 [Pyrus ussuriensis x Pyrus communis]|uniref:Uncharacterized protein n=1 Tax=Pyrus ussuriensis x Pyrus communis TaxID=2448454 RepID=A0A5N5IF68_9ROSA|nr:hypothetical protein D8674_026804 [Pyrus ussuriensis x Pyrus communis]